MQLFDSVFELFKIPFFIAIFEKQIGELVNAIGEENGRKRGENSRNQGRNVGNARNQGSNLRNGDGNTDKQVRNAEKFRLKK